MKSHKLTLAILVAVTFGLLGFGTAVRAQTWSDSFIDMGVIYTLSDLTFDQQATQRYQLDVNTAGYTGPSGAFLDSVNIKAWSGTDISFVLAGAPGDSIGPPFVFLDWGTQTEGPISSGPVANTGCKGTGSGFACVEASTKSLFSVGGTYTFLFDVTSASEDDFLASSIGAHVGAGYADSDGRGASYGITSVTMIPEPEIYAMLLAGLGLMGFVVRRRVGV